ncbi:hypothetical protein GCM10010340_26900 [Streptomyces griseoloalbus]|nr:hypothetical protein GCM10010340_26900 [Streptomyces albaduncus]
MGGKAWPVRAGAKCAADEPRRQKGETGMRPTEPKDPDAPGPPPAPRPVRPPGPTVRPPGSTIRVRPDRVKAGAPLRTGVGAKAGR